MRTFIILILSLFSLTTLLMDASSGLNTPIRFGSNNSAITIARNATLDVTKSFTNKEGEIRQRRGGSITGEKIYYDLGIIEQNHAPTLVTGELSPSSPTTQLITLRGTPQHPNIFRADPGTRIESIRIHGSHNRLEGLPLLNNPIVLADANTTVTIAIESTLNQNIQLSGGTIILDEHLTLADGVSLTGPGTVKLNNRRLEFGASSLTFTTPIYWVGAADVYINGRTSLSASWTFDKECYLNGDSVVMTLTGDGSLTIRKNSSLAVREIKIKGLGQNPWNGTIYFEDDSDPPAHSSSVLRLRRAALELTTTYTIKAGHVITEIGSNQAITRDNILWFEKPAHLTVDGTNFYYKTRTYPDDKNIRPRPYDDPTGPISLINNGDIFHYKALSNRRVRTLGEIAAVLSGNVYLGDEQEATLDLAEGNDEVEGTGWYVQFSREKEELLNIAPGTDGFMLNTVFKDFAPYHLNIGTGGTFAFGSNAVVELGEDISLDTGMTWSFENAALSINGQGHTITFNGGDIRLSGGEATLNFRNVTLKNVKRDSILIATEALGFANLTFENVRMYLAEDFEFAEGGFQVFDKLEVYSQSDEPVRFIYSTPDPPVDIVFSTPVTSIKEGSILHFDQNVTFSYAPKDPIAGHFANPRLPSYNLQFTDKSSILSLNGATLFSTASGLLLTNGTLLVDGKCFIESDATERAESISFGDGTWTDSNFDIVVLPGGSLNVMSGIVTYSNI